MKYCVFSVIVSDALFDMGVVYKYLIEIRVEKQSAIESATRPRYKATITFPLNQRCWNMIIQRFTISAYPCAFCI